MRTSLGESLLAGLAVLFLLVPTGVARAAGEGDVFRDDGSLRYRFYTGLELLYVERDRTPDVEVSFEGLREVLSTDAVVDDDEEFGGRGVLGFRLDGTSAIEAVYMGWGHEESKTKRRPVMGNLFAFEAPDAMAFPDESFDGAAVHDLEYDSILHSAELNYRHGLEVDGADYRFNLLAGIRALRLEEDLSLDSWDSPLLVTPPPASQIGQYDIATRNTLVGGQLGVETFIPLWDDWLDFDAYFAAGGYANQAKVFIDYFDGASGTQIRQSRSEWDPAGVLEAALHFKVRLWRGVRMNLGYRAVYLINIAAAPDQFSRSGSGGDFFGNSFDNDGKTVFHGPSIGLGVDF